MNKKLTLSIDPETVDRAKEYAKAKGQSLSEIIENYLKVISRQTEKPKISSKVSKLKGRIELPAGFDYKELLAETIWSKHTK